MDALWLIVVCVVGLFSFAAVLLVGAPYLPTLRPQVLTGLDLLHLKKGQTMLELGCGDGRVLLEAADLRIKTLLPSAYSRLLLFPLA